MTSFKEIIDLALVNITDYRLEKKYQEDPDGFQKFMTGFLLKGKTEFTNCKKDLSLTNPEKTDFLEDLSDIEKSILADLLVVQWLTKETNNYLQMTGLITDKDFKRFSEANNLNAKNENLNLRRKEVYQKMLDYSIANGDYLNGGK